MKNNKALYFLLAANAVSGFAQGISMLAIPWYFADILNDTTSYGIMYAIVTIATLFWGLYAGTLIDRFPRKNIFLSITAIGCIILLGVSMSGFYYGEVPIILVGVAFASTIFNYNIHYPSLYAFGQEITEKENYAKTNSLIEVQGQSTSVLSGAFAAILITGVNEEFLTTIGLNNVLNIRIEPWKLHEIFLLDACTYALAFVLILFIKYQPIVQKKVDTGSIWNRLKQGGLFLKKNPLLFHFGVASFSIFVIVLIMVHQLLPTYVSEYLDRGSEIYAGSEILYAIGALSAGLGIRWLFRNTNTIKAVIMMMLVTVVILEITAFTQSALILLLVTLTIGLTNAGTRILRITYLFNHVPNHIIGRTGSVFQSINIILRFGFISLFTIPFFTKDDNITWAFFISGIFVLVSILPLLIYYKRLIGLKINE